MAPILVVDGEGNAATRGRTEAVGFWQREGEGRRHCCSVAAGAEWRRHLAMEMRE